jgi:hypothetical protein
MCFIVTHPDIKNDDGTPIERVHVKCDVEGSSEGFFDALTPAEAEADVIYAVGAEQPSVINEFRPNEDDLSMLQANGIQVDDPELEEPLEDDNMTNNTTEQVFGNWGFDGICKRQALIKNQNLAVGIVGSLRKRSRVVTADHCHETRKQYKKWN